MYSQNPQQAGFGGNPQSSSQFSFGVVGGSSNTHSTQNPALGGELTKSGNLFGGTSVLFGSSSPGNIFEVGGGGSSFFSGRASQPARTTNTGGFSSSYGLSRSGSMFGGNMQSSSFFGGNTLGTGGIKPQGGFFATSSNTSEGMKNVFGMMGNTMPSSGGGIFQGTPFVGTSSSNPNTGGNSLFGSTAQQLGIANNAGSFFGNPGVGNIQMQPSGDSAKRGIFELSASNDASKGNFFGANSAPSTNFFAAPQKPAATGGFFFGSTLASGTTTLTPGSQFGANIGASSTSSVNGGIFGSTSSVPPIGGMATSQPNQFLSSGGTVTSSSFLGGLTFASQTQSNIGSKPPSMQQFPGFSGSSAVSSSGLGSTSFLGGLQSTSWAPQSGSAPSLWPSQATSITGSGASQGLGGLTASLGRTGTSTAGFSDIFRTGGPLGGTLAASSTSTFSSSLSNIGSSSSLFSAANSQQLMLSSYLPANPTVDQVSKIIPQWENEFVNIEKTLISREEDWKKLTEKFKKLQSLNSSIQKAYENEDSTIQSVSSLIVHLDHSISVIYPRIAWSRQVTAQIQRLRDQLVHNYTLICEQDVANTIKRRENFQLMPIQIPTPLTSRFYSDLLSMVRESKGSILDLKDNVASLRNGMGANELLAIEKVMDCQHQIILHHLQQILRLKKSLLRIKETMEKNGYTLPSFDEVNYIGVPLLFSQNDKLQSASGSSLVGSNFGTSFPSSSFQSLQPTTGLTSASTYSNIGSAFNTNLFGASSQPSQSSGQKPLFPIQSSFSAPNFAKSSSTSGSFHNIFTQPNSSSPLTSNIFSGLSTTFQNMNQPIQPAMSTPSFSTSNIFGTSGSSFLSGITQKPSSLGAFSSNFGK